MINPDVTPDTLNQMAKGNMIEHLGIVITEVGHDTITATMPVDHRTTQPFGLLHGGASVTLAETLGSYASSVIIDAEKQMCVGLDINANHIRAVTQGTVTGVTKPIHIGRSTHVWEIRITDEQNKLVAISRLTMAILDKK